MIQVDLNYYLIFYSSACGNPNLSSMVSCKNKSKKRFIVPVAASAGGAFVLVLSVAAIWWALTRKRQLGKFILFIFRAKMGFKKRPES